MPERTEWGYERDKVQGQTTSDCGKKSKFYKFQIAVYNNLLKDNITSAYKKIAKSVELDITKKHSKMATELDSQSSRLYSQKAGIYNAEGP